MKLPFTRSDSADDVAAAPGGGGGGAGTLLRLLVPLALVAFVVASIAVFYLSAQRSAEDARYFALFDRLQVLAQTVAKEAGVAVSGRDGAFRRLEAASGEFDASLLTLAEGDPAAALPALPSEGGLGAALGALNDTWSTVRQQSASMVEAQPAVNGFAARVEAWESAKVAVLDELATFIGTLQTAYAASPQLLGAADVAPALERVTAAMRQVLAGGQDAGAAADRLRVESDAIAGRLAVFAGEAPAGDGDVEAVEDPVAREALAQLAERFAAARAVVDEAVGFAPGVLGLQGASERVVEADESMLARIRALADGYRGIVSARPLSDALGIALGAGAVVMLLLLGLQLTRDARVRADRERALAEEARRREEQTRTGNQANQDAILRLLDEIGDLADGDLTTSATVTEDITGAIADAINFTIEALRDTVASINNASVKMVDAAGGSRDTALRLAESSETQASQIENAASAIRALAEVSRGVSGDAARGQEVATQQVRHANDGAEAVRATIDGMDVIRETIQETSKRIKRLGESSQEIGEIVSLIDDIADQTNILALNAAIQASMAGEQGRGFAVVADEVQRLAERASQATRQIDGLVKAIQSDTNEAVASMEQSTAGVVRGAGLAEDAGQALVRIELVSKDLEDIVSGIAGSANSQTDQAGQVARTMDEIQRMTTEARAGTQETASAIGGLAQLATDLRTSVSGFRLPDSGSGSSGT